MKKVYHIALSNPVFPNGGWQKAFEGNHYEYHVINWQKTKQRIGQLDMWLQIFKECAAIKPDLIFSQIQTPGILGIDEAKRLSEYGFTVNYTMDVREDLSWYEDIAEHIGLLLFCDYDSVWDFKKKGVDNVSYFQQSCDTDFYKPIETNKDYGEIVFIANKYSNSSLSFPLSKERDELVDYMKLYFGERFQVFGRGYGKILNPIEEREAYNSCKIAITHNLLFRNGYTSDRTFRAIACGAFTINKYYNGIEKDFPDGASWNTLDQLKKLCVSALFNEGIRKGEAERQRIYSINKHSWYSRIKKLNALINEQFSISAKNSRDI